MRTLVLTLATTAALALATATAAHAAPPADVPGTLHFDSGSSTVKARPANRKKVVRRSTARSNLNNQAARDGTGKQ